MRTEPGSESASARNAPPLTESPYPAAWPARHWKAVATGACLTAVGVTSAVVIVDHRPDRQAYSHAIPGETPDTSAAQAISYFHLAVPEGSYTYTSWTDPDSGHVLRIDLNASCAQVTDYAEANHMSHVGYTFLMDGVALASADDSGWKFDPDAPMFGRMISIDGGDARIEMIVAGGPVASAKVT
jgi:hypothetical protein